MSSSIKDRILGYLKTNRQARVIDLVRRLAPVSRMSIHTQLNKLVGEEIVERVGKSPLVFYRLSPKKELVVLMEVSKELKDAINESYLYITPQGQIVSGYEGFVTWITNTGQTDKLVQLAEQYFKTRKQYDNYLTADGWVDATFKIKETFGSDASLDKLLYADFYSLPQFGKTKLGTLMLYAKQSQNRELANSVCIDIRGLVRKIITRFKVDAVAYIPPSIPRNVQFMTELADCLNLALPNIALAKTRTGQVIVAQKTLEKLAERIVNARDTIFVKDAKLPYKNVLLIDDAVGSGASMNETAKKIKNTLAKAGQVIGFAVVGSFKGFEVIREV